MTILVTGATGNVGSATLAARGVNADVRVTTARLGLADSLTDDVRTVLSREPVAFRATPTVSKEAR